MLHIGACAELKICSSSNTHKSNEYLEIIERKTDTQKLTFFENIANSNENVAHICKPIFAIGAIFMPFKYTNIHMYFKCTIL